MNDGRPAPAPGSRTPSQAVTDRSFLQKLLDAVEQVGNNVPHPAIVFLAMSAIVFVLSYVLHLFGVSVT